MTVPKDPHLKGLVELSGSGHGSRPNSPQPFVHISVSWAQIMFLLALSHNLTKDLDYRPFVIRDSSGSRKISCKTKVELLLSVVLPTRVTIDILHLASFMISP